MDCESKVVVQGLDGYRSREEWTTTCLPLKEEQRIKEFGD